MSTCRAAPIADDVSSISDVDDRDYQTDYTTPAESEVSQEQVEPEEVEDFRDREYPQLKGRPYMPTETTTSC